MLFSLILELFNENRTVLNDLTIFGGMVYFKILLDNKNVYDCKGFKRVISAECRLTRGEIMKMRSRNMTLAGIILLVLAFTIGMAGATDQNTTGNETPAVNETGTPTATLTATATSTADAEAADDEESGEGLIGPGNALYGLQIAFENIGETFTFNASEKLGKQVAHARKRIAEARAALKRNDTGAADKALAEYRAKINDVNDSISKLSDKDIGLINAQQMIAKHQQTLEELLISHPNSTGLQRAYNNSVELKRKFESKVEQRLELDSNTTKGHQEIVKDEKTGESIKDQKSEKGINRGKGS